ncbi:glycerophosphodiester phosphodiesterase [Bacillus carboniphilus]|uniref:Glycerophosphodiester phosphodiesterase n=1 Tax=Bacillus carboniphilus TaxID=86663 RepID=A0ABP3FYN1_9BACI
MSKLETELKPRRKWRKGFKWSLLTIAVVVLVLFIFPGPKAEHHPFLDLDKPLVIAHQGGALLAPSNTMVAFENAVDLDVDVLEFDIHITKDGQLVVIHDPTVDRTTDGTGKVEDMTLEELKKLDAGYYFKDVNGDFPFRDQGITIPTVEEVFSAFPSMPMMIEIKDDNPPERLEEISQKLWALIQKYNMADQTLVASFDQNIIEMFQKVSKNQVALGGGRGEAKPFVISSMLSMQPIYNPKVQAFQLPLKDGKINLSKPYIVENAHKRGMEVYYWTINDPKVMETLVKQGADGIITDRPDLLIDVLSIHNK